MSKKHLARTSGYLILICVLIIMFGVVSHRTCLLDSEMLRRPFYDWKMDQNNSLTDRSVRCLDCNIILVVISNLRPDHLGCYGYFKNTSPNIDSLAASGFLFHNVFTNSINELAAHMSLFTGLLPKSHHVFDIYQNNLSSDVQTLPEILKEYGYTTIWSAARTNAHLDPRRGFERGFDYYSEHPLWENAFKWVGQNSNEKFFLFMHTSSTHDPYLPPPNSIEKFTASRPQHIIDNREELDEELYYFIQKQLNQDPDFLVFDNKKIVNDYHLKLFEGDFTEQKRQQLRNLTSSNALFFFNLKDRLFWNSIDLNSLQDLEYVKGLYDTTIFSVDLSIGMLLDVLEKNGLMDKTVIIITSMTGEEFMEHGHIDHGQLYDEVIRVPLIISTPSFSGAALGGEVQTVDIMPTLLALIGKDTPDGIQGTNLLPSMTMLKNASNRFYTTTSSYDGVTYRSESWKWIIKDTSQELFYLKSDPSERNNLLETER